MLQNYELIYTSVGTNKSSNIMAWNIKNKIAYAFSNSIAIYSPYIPNDSNSGKIVQIFNGHVSEITFLEWGFYMSDNILISGSKDGLIILWHKNQKLKFQWHNQHITAVSTKAINNLLLIVSTSMDSSLYIALTNDQGHVLVSESLSLGYEVGLCLSTTYLTPTQVLVACGLTNGDIRVYPVTFKMDEGSADCLNPSASFQKFLHVTLRGHLDWIRGLDFVTLSGTIYMVSCSQDCTIRVWKMTPHQDSEISGEPSGNPSLRTNTECITDELGRAYEINLESTLHSHKNWIYSVKWHPLAADSKSTHSLSFLSASIDETCVLWSYAEGSGIWLDEVRLGTIKGLGFYGACYGPGGEGVLANAINGSLYMWSKVGGRDGSSLWKSYLMVTGHGGPVVDLCWEPEGTYLLTTSSDQTTRLHAPWVGQGESGDGIWLELCRSQVHGYDMTCLAILNAYTYASGSEEKVVRIFKAPRSFLTNFARWTGLELLTDREMDSVRIPETASNNPLDLTNLSIYSTDDSVERQNLTANSSALEEYPTENLLHQSTLWPEERKLYGHGYDIHCLDYNPVHNLLASACKATKPDFASVFLWDCATWKLVGKLAGHSLTVTRLRFSKDGSLLLTVSRDRTWNVYRKAGDGVPDLYFKLDGLSPAKNKAVSHSRIIWDCCFLDGPPVAQHHFVTVSRDKKAILWTRRGEMVGDDKPPIWDSDKNGVLLLETPITAVATRTLTEMELHDDKRGEHLIAFGLETGEIRCYEVRISSALCPASIKPAFYYLFRIPISHSMTVERLAFKPTTKRDDRTNPDHRPETVSAIILASCSDDHSVRLHKFSMARGDAF